MYHVTKLKSVKAENSENIIQNYQYLNIITLENHLEYSFHYTVTYLRSVTIAKIDQLRKINSNIGLL